jgi:hypothetical protein
MNKLVKRRLAIKVRSLPHSYSNHIEIIQYQKTQARKFHLIILGPGTYPQNSSFIRPMIATSPAEPGKYYIMENGSFQHKMQMYAAN